MTLGLGTCIMVLGSKCLQLTRPDEFVLVSHMHMKLGISKQRVLVVVVFLTTYAVTGHAWKTDVFCFFFFLFLILVTFCIEPLEHVVFETCHFPLTKH